jgi:COP9 signalosome complex subunit 1
VLDIFIQNHIDGLMYEIRSKSMVQYMLPFQSLQMDTMASIFLMTTQELESQIYHLILNGQIDARIDNQNKVGFINIDCEG